MTRPGWKRRRGGGMGFVCATPSYNGGKRDEGASGSRIKTVALMNYGNLEGPRSAFTA